MIIYTTKLMRDRYKIKMPEDYVINKNIVDDLIEKESGDRMLEWGAKLFYFTGRKCIQIVHFASKFTVFLCDIKVADLPNVGKYLSMYLYDIYSDDTQMTFLLERFFSESPVICFSKLTDRSAISTLNKTQLDFTWDGKRFYRYIENGVLKTREINKDVNTDWFFTQKIDGKTEYFFAKDRFRQLLLERYKLNPDFNLPPFDTRC